MPGNFLLKRILYSILFGLLIGVIVSEVPFLFLRETARPPREIVLTIPAGTSAQVTRGEQPPSIPENMTFVVGDTLSRRFRPVSDTETHRSCCNRPSALRMGVRLTESRRARSLSMMRVPGARRPEAMRSRMRV